MSTKVNQSSTRTTVAQQHRLLVGASLLASATNRPLTCHKEYYTGSPGVAPGAELGATNSPCNCDAARQCDCRVDAGQQLDGLVIKAYRHLHHVSVLDTQAAKENAGHKPGCVGKWWVRARHLAVSRCMVALGTPALGATQPIHASTFSRSIWRASHPAPTSCPTAESGSSHDSSSPTGREAGGCVTTGGFKRGHVMPCWEKVPMHSAPLLVCNHDTEV